MGQQGLRRGVARLQAIFMKAIAAPGPAEVAMPLALQFGHAPLGIDRRLVEDRMGVADLAQHGVLGGLAQRVERHHDGALRGQGLQLVEQVVQADGWLLAVRVHRAFVIPRGPGLARLWQQAGVGVQQRAVGLVADGPEHFALGRAGGVDQGESLIAVAGEDHFVEPDGAARRMQFNPVVMPHHPLHGSAQTRVGQLGEHFLHILPRAAAHGEPLRPVVDLQQAVVVAEAHQRGQRKVEHLPRWARPDAGGHRQQIPVQKRIAIAFATQVVAHGLVEVEFGVGFARQRRGFAVETQDVAQHPPEGRSGQVAALGENRVQVGAAPFQRVAVGQRGLNRERHVGGRQRHVQLGEQRLQLGIGALVEHQKTRVHGERHFAGQIDIHRVGVAAKVRTGLEQRDLRPMAQGPRRPEA